MLHQDLPPPYYPEPSAPSKKLQKELEENCELVKAALNQYGFKEGHESQIAVFLDVSASMENPNGFYFGPGYTEDEKLRNGMVQKALIKALSLAVELSPNHLITIFPFGSAAYAPVTITEDEIEEAAIKIFRSINRTFSKSTDYYLPLAAVRQHYFHQSGLTTTDQPYAGPPVFAIWLTDGDSNANFTNAMNEFRSSAFNAIFHKFIALRGHNAKLNFSQLETICNIKANLPNRDLVILNTPDELTIPYFFKYYRLWLEEAHDHKILVNDPCIDMNVANPDFLNQQEIRTLESLEAEHEHDHDEGSALPKFALSRNILMQNRRPQPKATVTETEENICKCVLL